MEVKQHIFVGVGVVVLVVILFFVFNAAPATAPEEDVPAVETFFDESETTITNEEIIEELLPKDSSQKTTREVTTPIPVLTPPVSIQNTTSPTKPLPITATVIYDGSRFLPEEVTIIRGGTVRFLNISNRNMWVSSDNHPTHARYPVKDEASCSGQSFDQCASVGKNDSWTFIFTRLGTWGYHNHEDARDDGTVTVVTREEYLENEQKRIGN